LGFWGTIINGIQAAGLEHRKIHDAPWTGATVGLLIAYTAGMIILQGISAWLIIIDFF
jgi:solute carrier family 35, member F1/2